MHVSDTLLFKRFESMAEVSLVDVTMLYNDTKSTTHNTHTPLQTGFHVHVHKREQITS